ncbi:proline--tRNA ligase [Candidatus Marsarchaeota G2 archaeon ECH_B_SAG-G16]|uniref:Proline--tRNA ligase n=2 Tax=Candidatus Marsarchaeota group 2 TaxID=2203771 RepID=A0A2R6C2V8_9ARCH|nr:MAG: proline--tRNA ligase [Candidatus Marsarchaeota G2 archaeon ECH_B_SAG-G16]
MANEIEEIKTKLGITVKKEEDLSEWYQQVVLKSGLADYSPVSGCMVYLPWGYSIWEEIRNFLDSKLKALGHKNAYFPLFIPESLLKKESEHFKGFTPEVAWVESGGKEKLEERLAIRPTSETIMYVMYSKWIKSYRDLPLLLNQWNNVVRWETKATKLFLRTREFLWQEGHTAHATKEEADREVLTILNVYQDLLVNLLAIPVLVGLKSEGEKFAGALYTATLEAIMPDGKALQAGTSHNLGQNFSRAFDIQFITKEQKKEYVWQTSWGVSTRLIGALVMIHGDNKGLVLPPRVAPIQIIIIPIYYSKSQAEVIIQKSKEIKNMLLSSGLRVEIDDRDDKTPGWKFNEWELKGVPVRLEIGPKDLEKSSVVVFRRDTLQKSVVQISDLLPVLNNLLNDIHQKMLERARKKLEESISQAEDYNEFKEKLEKRGGFIKVSWCGRLECESQIKNETGASVRLIPFENNEPFKEYCFHCGEKAQKLAYFAKSY